MGAGFDQQDGYAEQGRSKHANEDEAVHQVEHRVDLGAHAKVAHAQDLGQVLDGALSGAFGPAELLVFERVHLSRQFCRRTHIDQVLELPAFELCAVAEVEVFGDGVVLPAAGFLDALVAPHAGGAVEVDEVSALVAAALLHGKVRVQAKGLQTGEHAVVFVEVLPAGLHHAQVAVFDHVRDGAAQEVLARHKIRIKNGGELAFAFGQAVRQRASLVAHAVGALDVDDVQTFGLPALDAFGGHLKALVCAVVQHLDFELVFGVVDFGHGVDQALHHVELVEHRQLHGHVRPFVVFQLRGDFGVGLVPVSGVGPRQVQLHQAVKEDEGEEHPVDDENRKCQSTVF